MPLIRDGEPIGVLAVWRKDVKPFTDLEIGVVETFADQIGIAVRLVGLLDETSEALERESAVAQVLASIARSRFDLQSVLDSVTESAVRLSGADSGNMALIADGRYRIAASFGEKSAELRRMFEASRIELDRGSLVGRVTMEGGTVQIDDVLADPEYAHLDMQQVVGFRTLLGVPLMREGKPIGVLIMQRIEVRPFTGPGDRAAQTFADQAAIAIANASSSRRSSGSGPRWPASRRRSRACCPAPEGEQLLAGHRREISAMFCDMRGFTAFAETAEPEELFSVLRAYHAEVGGIALGNGGTVEHFAGDGFMIFFNDPAPVADHPLAAVRTACAMQDRFAELAAGWRRRGYELGLGIGIASRLRHARPDRVRGALRLRRRWGPSSTWPRGSASRRGRPDPHSASAHYAAVEEAVEAAERPASQPEGLRPPRSPVWDRSAVGLRSLADGGEDLRRRGPGSRPGTRSAPASAAATQARYSSARPVRS